MIFFAPKHILWVLIGITLAKQFQWISARYFLMRKLQNFPKLLSAITVHICNSNMNVIVCLIWMDNSTGAFFFDLK